MSRTRIGTHPLKKSSSPPKITRVLPESSLVMALSTLHSFHSSDSLWGRTQSDYYPGFRFYGTGFLTNPWREQFEEQLERDEIRYVVYSYTTPIAWWHGGEWTVPEVEYGNSRMTKHQRKITETLSQMKT